MLNSVELIVSDGKIWNEQQSIIDLIAACNKGPVAVMLRQEGPCCETSGINNLINMVLNYTATPASHITLYTGNLLASSAFTEIKLTTAELNLAKQYINTDRSTLSKRFGLFIGRSNANRLGIASHLHKHFKDQTEMTFHFDPTNEYHKNNFGLEEFLEKFWEDRHDVFNFLDHVPVISKAFDAYPIQWDNGAYQLSDKYKNIFVDIVCETFTTGRTFFMTEKTLRCIAMCRPFVVVGPRYYLENLKRLGFKTFDTWWSEGYDSDSDDARYKSILQTIDWIGSQNKIDILRWYEEMQPVLEHNTNILQALNSNMLKNKEFYYKEKIYDR